MSSASGHGISEAVRQMTRQWIDDDLTKKLARAANISNYSTGLLRDPKQWARVNSRGGKGFGQTRLYRNNAVPGIALEIRTNEPERGKKADSEIVYFAFKAGGRFGGEPIVYLGGKYIDGGTCKVASMFGDKRKDVARVEEGKGVAKTKFRRLTEDELNKLNTEAEFDGLAALFEERVA